MKATPKNIKIGDRVKLKQTTTCRYFNYPRGQNLKLVRAGSICEVLSILPKVKKFPKSETQDGYDYFLNICNDQGTKTVVNFCQIEKIKKG